jgi:hypothetical protein
LSAAGLALAQRLSVHSFVYSNEYSGSILFMQ